MKKTYIIPTLSVVNTVVDHQLLVSSIKISNTTVTGGMVKSEGDWDIWGSDEVDFDEE